MIAVLPYQVAHGSGSDAPTGVFVAEVSSKIRQLAASCGGFHEGLGWIASRFMPSSAHGTGTTSGAAALDVAELAASFRLIAAVHQALPVSEGPEAIAADRAARDYWASQTHRKLTIRR